MPSRCDPMHLTLSSRDSRLNQPKSVAPLSVSGRRLRRDAAQEAEVRLEAHVDQKAHLRVSKVHQRGIPPALLRWTRHRAAPERLHLLLDLKHNLAPKGLAQIERAGQPHRALLSWFIAPRISRVRGHVQPRRMPFCSACRAVLAAE